MLSVYCIKQGLYTDCIPYDTSTSRVFNFLNFINIPIFNKKFKIFLQMYMKHTEWVVFPLIFLILTCAMARWLFFNTSRVYMASIWVLSCQINNESSSKWYFCMHYLWQVTKLLHCSNLPARRSSWINKSQTSWQTC